MEMKDTIGMELKYFFVVTCAVFLLVSNSIAEEDAPSDEHSSVAESTLVDEEGEPEPESIPKPDPRQRPGNDESPVVFPPYVYESLPRLDSSATGFVPVPDRWRQLYAGKWYDPYNQNVLKGDVPIFGHPGHEWFFEAELISETLVQRTKIALPVGLASTSKPGRVDTLGNGNLSIFLFRTSLPRSPSSAETLPLSRRSTSFALLRYGILIILRRKRPAFFASILLGARRAMIIMLASWSFLQIYIWPI